MPARWTSPEVAKRVREKGVSHHRAQKTSKFFESRGVKQQFEKLYAANFDYPEDLLTGAQTLVIGFARSSTIDKTPVESVRLIPGDIEYYCSRGNFDIGPNPVKCVMLSGCRNRAYFGPVNAIRILFYK